MKFFFALCCCFAMIALPGSLAAAEWNTDFEKAKAESAQTKRPIFVLFTNSESAGCIGYDRAIFNAKKFLDYADKNLVLMKVDFPTTLHRQPAGVAEQNRKLRLKFGATIPSAYLLDQNGELYVNFTKVEKTPEAHRRKLNEIMEFDPPKAYSEYIAPFVKAYVPPKPAEAPKKAEATKPAKKPVKKPAEKPAEKTDDKGGKAPENAETIIPDENAGTPLIPINPEGDVQDWLKSRSAGEAAEEAAEAEEVVEAVESEKEALEEADEAKTGEEKEASAEAKDATNGEAKETAPAA